MTRITDNAPDRNIQGQASRITAVLILGHGSPVSKANNTLLEVAEAVRMKGGYGIVQPAFLQFEHPNFAEAVDIIVGMGAQQIIVHPYFLYMGAHVTKDLPFEIGTVKKKYPDIEFILAPHLGYHEKLVDIAVERIESVKNKKSEVRSQKSEGNRITPFPTSHIPHPTSQIAGQHPIEAESFRIIGEQLDGSRFSSLELPIVKRIIHTTADFEYAEIVRFGNNAIEAGMDAISKGADIIADVKMVAVGISKERLDKFGGKVRCFVADEDVVCQAKMNNVTRTAMGIKKALSPTSHIPHSTSKIVVIGNAPTALLELIKIIKTGHERPALVIGVPVGFVDAEESKEGLMGLDVPYISIKGRKGGSTVAVAIVNALLMMAEGKAIRN